jgi:hypothetical protein
LGSEEFGRGGVVVQPPAGGISLRVGQGLWGLTRSLWKATGVSAKRRREWTTRTGCGNNGGETNSEEQDLVDVENRRHDEGQSISEEGTSIEATPFVPYHTAIRIGCSRRRYHVIVTTATELHQHSVDQPD